MTALKSYEVPPHEPRSASDVSSGMTPKGNAMVVTFASGTYPWMILSSSTNCRCTALRAELREVGVIARMVSELEAVLQEP